MGQVSGTEFNEYGADEKSHKPNDEKPSNDGGGVDAVVGTFDAGVKWFHYVSLGLSF
jgi:hypothetical protein